ncbi:Uncharacterised protein [uncultured archaeon]|nr:Uncharacterised protein [uncultured archaeon]
MKPATITQAAKSPQKKAPAPMEEPGFGWRVGISVLVVFGWVIFLVVWLLFYAGSFSGYQNLAVILVSLLVGIAILVASWASWGVKYGYKYRHKWKEECNEK